jgi:carbon starvation protein CstA
MVSEGIVALVWAAAAIAFTGGYDQLAEYMAAGHNPSSLVKDISMTWLGPIGGILAIIGVIAAPISSGDTALRSARLIIADTLKIGQKKLWRRILVSIFIFAIAFLLMMIDFNVLWRYFAWCNQTLAVFTLWAVTVWLARNHKCYIITLIPALFMTVVCTCYLLYAPRPEGIGLSQSIALGSGIVVAIILFSIFLRWRSQLPAITKQ